jgi:hypothetical protein
MFQRLMKKWGVGWLQLVLILCTFALGGSLCGYLAKLLMPFTGIGRGAFWVVVYIIIVTILWPVCVLAISILTGQFPFFKKYIHKIGKRMFSSKRSQPRS